jgi:general stress protein CsbA
VLSPRWKESGDQFFPDLLVSRYVTGQIGVAVILTISLHKVATSKLSQATSWILRLQVFVISLNSWKIEEYELETGH